MVGQPSGYPRSSGGSRVNLLASSGYVGGANALGCASRVEKGRNLGVIKCFDYSLHAIVGLLPCMEWKRDSALCR